jgi:hypothetical protein
MWNFVQLFDRSLLEWPVVLSECLTFANFLGTCTLFLKQLHGLDIDHCPILFRGKQTKKSCQELQGSKASERKREC